MSDQAPENLRDKLVAHFAVQVAQARERLCWKMIADGRLPSMGWGIGEEYEFDGARMKYRCWPTPPAR